VTRPVAIVSGAGSGIGAVIATRLASRYDLILTHRHDDQDLDTVLARVERYGAAAVAVTGDLTDPATIDLLRHEIDHAADRLEVLVSNAGAYPRIPWRDLDPDAFRRQIEIDLVTHAACAHLVTPAFTARERGRIVAVSSVLIRLGRVDLAGYIAAKSGLEGLIRALARELGPHDTTVNCIRAGSIEVPAEHTVVPITTQWWHAHSTASTSNDVANLLTWPPPFSSWPLTTPASSPSWRSSHHYPAPRRTASSRANRVPPAADRRRRRPEPRLPAAR